MEWYKYSRNSFDATITNYKYKINFNMAKFQTSCYLYASPQLIDFNFLWKDLWGWHLRSLVSAKKWNSQLPDSVLINDSSDYSLLSLFLSFWCVVWMEYFHHLHFYTQFCILQRFGKNPFQKNPICLLSARLQFLLTRIVCISPLFSYFLV